MRCADPYAVQTARPPKTHRLRPDPASRLQGTSPDPGPRGGVTPGRSRRVRRWGRGARRSRASRTARRTQACPSSKARKPAVEAPGTLRPGFAATASRTPGLPLTGTRSASSRPAALPKRLAAHCARPAAQGSGEGDVDRLSTGSLPPLDLRVAEGSHRVFGGSKGFGREVGVAELAEAGL